MTSLALKVLVGSRAHGLAREDSDYDFRVVFVMTRCRCCSECRGWRYLTAEERRRLPWRWRLLAALTR